MLAWSQPSTNRLLASRYVQELQSALQSYGKIVVYKSSAGTTKRTYEQRRWRKETGQEENHCKGEGIHNGAMPREGFSLERMRKLLRSSRPAATAGFLSGTRVAMQVNSFRGCLGSLRRPSRYVGRVAVYSLRQGRRKSASS